MLIWVYLTIVLSFAMSFSIGANDAANGMATSYGSKALPLRYLLIIGASAEFIGALFCSNKVASTLGYEVISGLASIQSE